MFERASKEIEQVTGQMGLRKGYVSGKPRACALGVLLFYEFPENGNDLDSYGRLEHDHINAILDTLFSDYDEERDKFDIRIHREDDQWDRVMRRNDGIGWSFARFAEQARKKGL
jgi:hypothetical protein